MSLLPIPSRGGGGKIALSPFAQDIIQKKSSFLSSPGEPFSSLTAFQLGSLSALEVHHLAHAKSQFYPVNILLIKFAIQACAHLVQKMMEFIAILFTNFAIVRSCSAQQVPMVQEEIVAFERVRCRGSRLSWMDRTGLGGRDLLRLGLPSAFRVYWYLCF